MSNSEEQDKKKVMKKDKKWRERAGESKRIEGGEGQKKIQRMNRKKEEINKEIEEAMNGRRSKTLNFRMRE